MQKYLKEMGEERNWGIANVSDDEGSERVQKSVAAILNEANWDSTINKQYSKKLLESIGDGVSKFANVGGEVA
jgi:hypothetical protein